MIAGKEYEKCVDVWSLGVLLYEMLHGRVPFKAKNHAGLLKLMKDGTVKLDDRLSHEAKHLLYCLLRYRPDDRITLDDIRTHQWVLKYSSDRKFPNAAGDYQPESPLPTNSFYDDTATKITSGVSPSDKNASMDSLPNTIFTKDERSHTIQDIERDFSAQKNRLEFYPPIEAMKSMGLGDKERKSIQIKLMDQLNKSNTSKEAPPVHGKDFKESKIQTLKRLGGQDGNQIFCSNKIGGQDLAKKGSRHTVDTLPMNKNLTKEHVSCHLFKRNPTLEFALTGEAHDHAFANNQSGTGKLDPVKEEEETCGFFGKIIKLLGCGNS
jgi:serine/threonine protein kinase